MTKSWSCKRFFEIQELVEALAAILPRKDLSALSRTSRGMHLACTPAFYKDLDICAGCDENKLLGSNPGLLALVQNIQHVKKLALGPEEVTFYYNCLLSFDQNSKSSSFKSSNPPATRPLWLPPADPCTRAVIPMPPMVNLSELRLFSDCVYEGPCNYLMPSAEDPQANMAQFCWILCQSPTLTFLELDFVSIQDLYDFGILIQAISSLEQLQELHISSIYYESSVRVRGASDLFFSLPSSVRRVHINIVFSDPHESSSRQSSNSSSSDDDEQDRGWASVPKRETALSNLEDLTLWNVFDNTSTTADILAIFRHCPNIKKLQLPSISSRDDFSTIADFIGQYCPHLRSLDCHEFVKGADDLFPFRIMDSMPTQRVEKLIFSGSFTKLTDPTTDLALQKHAKTLQMIDLTQFHHSSRMSVSSFIFKECLNISSLSIGALSDSLYITLDDAIEVSWSCNTLQQLKLCISGCELPCDPEIDPYYSRTAPISLTKAEEHQFSRLERLYYQIGRLSELQRLELLMVRIDEQGQVKNTPWDQPLSLPGLLTLGDESTGRPGYLNHLAGLAKLRKLLGSVRADAKDTAGSVGWNEARWMDKHWPRLVCARMFWTDALATEPFQWLKNQRHISGEKLLLGD
ncbi:hypothetical protein BGZ95_007381 [Linnemannia exigua]|uniref:Uncharacterized protein n=1 Tax=Linnemannia exigua TaxID=604196 RepID=A0AAD4DLB8_9FUNG|nr:hypothetical protein BGZ95_007381 [Linnemannia exigua]